MIGKGVRPALYFINRDQVAVDLGILVDRHVATSAPDVYAASDAAEGVDLDRGIRWGNAIEQGGVLLFLFQSRLPVRLPVGRLMQPPVQLQAGIRHRGIKRR